MSFQDRLRDKQRSLGHSICVGIDPHPSEPGTFLHSESVRTGSETFLNNYVRTLIDATCDVAGVVKFQSALFEGNGVPGFKALETGIRYAKQKNQIVILDAKRGDISSTMGAYGRAAFDVFGADALTVTPYMGWDVFVPLLPWLRQDRGAYSVWLTSNATAREIQSVTTSPSQKTLTAYIAETICGHARQEGVMNAIGWVAGATRTAELHSELSVFGEPVSLLLPGVGAQGGALDASLKAILAEHPTSLIPISRGLTSPGDKSDSVRNWDDFGAKISMALTSYVDQSR